MRVKHIILGIIALLCLSGGAMAANGTNPFSLGNAKVFWDAQDSEFHNTFGLVTGLFFLAIGTVVIFSAGGNVASFSAQKSGSFEDPEKKSGSGKNLIGIVFMVLGLVLFLAVILPTFGF